MYKISFLELSDITANQVKLPYSTGLIWGYCKLNPLLEKNYSFDLQAHITEIICKEYKIEREK